MELVKMVQMRNVVRAASALVMVMASAAALAHPKLLSSTPAEGAMGEAPQKIELEFSENLVKQFSGATLTMTEMPGMQGTMKTPASVSSSADPKVMVITPTQPLSTGTYRVDWRAVSSDTHPITGNFSFKVK
jgi:methionine-rich copper-binding protein CopC